MKQPNEPCSEKWLTVKGIPTCVQISGGWTSDEMNGDSLIIVISGNPGVSNFYVPFIKGLHEKSGGMSVWAIGHVGHMYHPESPSIKDKPELFALEGQIQHKKDFINDYVPKDKQIILIGHSIGAKMCVELMKDESISTKVKQVHLVFPCLENIGTTQNGVMFQKYGVRLFTILAQCVKPLKFLPFAVTFFVLKCLAMLRFMMAEFDDSLIRGMVALIGGDAIMTSVFLAKDEMERVKELDDEVYEKWGSKMCAYYGQRDPWCPLSHYENLKKKHPNVSTKLMDNKFEHAFVARHSLDMAEEVLESMQQLSKCQ